MSSEQLSVTKLFVVGASFRELTSPIYYLSSGIDLSLYQFCSEPKQLGEGFEKWFMDILNFQL
ncbi:MAG: hypothetical protein WBA39_21925 [Rivularia sp. (in: cyanobacteria)]